jgi:hypothetical protein
LKIRISAARRANNGISWRQKKMAAVNRCGGKGDRSERRLSEEAVPEVHLPTEVRSDRGKRLEDVMTGGRRGRLRETRDNWTGSLVTTALAGIWDGLRRRMILPRLPAGDLEAREPPPEGQAEAG